MERADTPTRVDALAYARTCTHTLTLADGGGEKGGSCSTDVTDKHERRKRTGRAASTDEHDSGWSSVTVSSASTFGTPLYKVND